MFIIVNLSKMVTLVQFFCSLLRFRLHILNKFNDPSRQRPNATNVRARCVDTKLINLP